MTDLQKKLLELADEFTKANDAATAMAFEHDVAKSIRQIHAAATLGWLPSTAKKKEELAEGLVIARRGETIGETKARIEEFIKEFNASSGAMARLTRKAAGAAIRIGFKAGETYGSTDRSDYVSASKAILKDVPIVADPVVHRLKQRGEDMTKQAFYIKQANACLAVRNQVTSDIVKALIDDIRPILSDAIAQNRDHGLRENEFLRKAVPHGSKHEIEARADLYFASLRQMSARTVVSELDKGLREASPAFAGLIRLACPDFPDRESQELEFSLKGMGLLSDIADDQLTRNEVLQNPPPRVRADRELHESYKNAPAEILNGHVLNIAAALSVMPSNDVAKKLDHVRKAIRIAELTLHTENALLDLERKRLHGIDGAFEGGHRWTLTPHDSLKTFVEQSCAGRDVKLFDNAISSRNSAKITDVLAELRLAIDLSELVGLRDYKRLPEAKKFKKACESAYDALKGQLADGDKHIVLALNSIPSLRQITRLADERQEVSEIKSNPPKPRR